MTRLTVANVKSSFPAKLDLHPATLELATQAMKLLWTGRCEERDLPPSDDRSGSCKFAALLARELFGGRLAGNLNHVFVVLPNGAGFDLNHDQADVLAMGEAAHQQLCQVLLHPDYRESLASCLPRVQRWAKWAIETWEAGRAS